MTLPHVTGQKYKQNPSVPHPTHTHTHTRSHSSLSFGHTLQAAVSRLHGGRTRALCSTSRDAFPISSLLFPPPTMAAAVDKTRRPVNFLCKSRSKQQEDQPEVYSTSRIADKHLVRLNPTTTIESARPGDPRHRLVKSKAPHLVHSRAIPGAAPAAAAGQSRPCPPKRTKTEQTGRSASLHT